MGETTQSLKTGKFVYARVKNVETHEKAVVRADDLSEESLGKLAPAAGDAVLPNGTNAKTLASEQVDTDAVTIAQEVILDLTEVVEQAEEQLEEANVVEVTLSMPEEGIEVLSNTRNDIEVKVDTDSQTITVTGDVDKVKAFLSELTLITPDVNFNLRIDVGTPDATSIGVDQSTISGEHDSSSTTNISPSEPISFALLHQTGNAFYLGQVTKGAGVGQIQRLTDTKNSDTYDQSLVADVEETKSVSTAVDTRAIDTDANTGTVNAARGNIAQDIDTGVVINRNLSDAPQVDENSDIGASGTETTATNTVENTAVAEPVVKKQVDVTTQANQNSNSGSGGSGGGGGGGGPSNTAPVAVNDTLGNVNEDAQLAFNKTDLLGNDTDADSDTLSITSISAANGTVTDNLDGTYTYQGNAEYSGADTITYTVSDGNGGTDTATASITVNVVDDTPINTIQDIGVSTNEDTALTFNTANSNLISVGDVDTGNLTVTVAVTNGTLTLAQTTGLTFDAGADGTATMTISGTIANINAALDGLQYDPTGGYNGADTLTITSSDGSTQDVDNVNITVGAVNDAPVNTVQDTTVSVNEDNTLTFNAANSNLISVADSDSGSLSVTLTVSNGTLTLAQTTGLSFDAGADGTATMTISGTIANINAALDGLQYDPTANYNGPDTLNITTSDGELQDADSTNITINAVADTPVNTVQDSTVSTNEDTALTFNAANSNLISVGDNDGGNLTVTLAVSNGTLTLAQTTGLTFDAGADGTATMTISGTIANINAAIDGLQYDPTGGYNGADTLTVTTSDGGLQDVDNVAITVNAVNDAPVNTIQDTTVSVAEDGTLTFNSANSNLISVADTDSGSLTVTLSVSNGTITLAQTTGLTFDAGADGTATMTISGTTANINAALDGMQYDPTANYNGSDTLNITTSDGSLQDADSASITITSVDDTPTNTIQDSVVDTNQDTTLTFNAANSNLISVGDIDTGSLTVTLAVSNGTVTLAQTTGLTFDAGADGTATMTISGTIANINAAIDGLQYDPTASYTGADTLVVTTSDGSTQDVDNVNITVNTVNTAPTNTLQSTAESVQEDIGLVFNSANSNLISVGDAEGGNLTVTLAVDDGTITLSQTTGLTFDAGSNNSASMTVTGSIANINAALDGMGYKGTLNFNGSDTLTITTSDGSLQDVDTVDITVTAVNDGPTITSTPPANNVVLAGNTYNYTVTATDPEGDNITALLDDSSWLSASSTGPGTFLLTGSTSDGGIYDISITARDQHGAGGDPQAFQVIVADFIGTASGEAIKAGGSGDLLLGEGGNDTVIGSDSDDTIYGGDGDDSIMASNGEDSIFGEAGDDTIAAGSGVDTVEGGTGNDTIDGEAGADSIEGGAGADSIMGGGDGDRLYGGDDDDTLDGEAGSDQLYGEGGNDVLIDTGGGNDTINGGAGADTLGGGAGKDNLTGGSGNDVFQFDLDTAGNDDTITDFATGDKIWLKDSVFNFDNGPTSPGDDLELDMDISSIAGFAGGNFATSVDFLYDTTDGQLWFDADGTGAGTAVLIATISNFGSYTFQADDFAAY